MELHDVIEGVLRDEISPLAAPEEAAWLTAWRDRHLSDEPIEVMSALGGALADRLAWVFLSGYQATIYRCFPDLPREPGWTSFVNTEDRSGQLPGTSLTGEGDTRRLNGWKGWLAASMHAGRLLVSAQQEHTPFILLRRDAPGVSITHRDAPSYLPELTQGRVQFEDVAVPDALLTGDAQTFPTFRAGESAYIRVALNAFMLSHARRLGAPPDVLTEIVAALLASAGMVRMPVPSLASLVAARAADQATQRIIPVFEALLAEGDAVLLERWTRDRRLVTGPSERLAERARTEIGG